MRPPDRRRGVGRAMVAVSVVAGLGAGLSACSNSGDALARQACAKVHRSIQLLDQAEATSDRARSGALKVQAYAQLREAVPISAEAAFADGQWQALMTTLSESGRVPETTLLTALKAQCAVAASPDEVGGNPSPTGSIPPPGAGLTGQ